MRVKNDFPDVDRVLSKLRNYVRTLEQKKEAEKDPEEKEWIQEDMHYVDDFITAISRYLDSVCNGEDRIERANQQYSEVEDIQAIVKMEDEKRTLYHSNIIRTMMMIDKTALSYGIDKVFDYSGEFTNFSQLTPNSPEEKSRMSMEARIKRREMGNFGLYIAASVTAGINKNIMLTDDEARTFASCESDNIINTLQAKTNKEIYDKVKENSKIVRKNIEKILE